MSNKIFALLAVALGAVALLAICIIVLLNKRSVVPITPTLPPPKTQIDQFMDLAATLTKTPKGIKELNLYLTPVKGSQALSALALKVTVTDPQGTITPLASTAKIPKVLTAAGWKFPFSKIASPAKNALELNLSAIFATPQPYLVENRLLIASIPLTSKNDTLTVTIDPTVTKVLDKQNREIGLQQINQPLTVTAVLQ